MLLADFNSVHALRNQLLNNYEIVPWDVVTDSIPAADTCPYDVSTRRFVCPTMTTSNGLTMTRSFQLLDVSGVPQSAFSPTETRAIRAVADLNGTVDSTSSTPPYTLKVSSHREHTLSGLPGGTHTLSGIRSTTVNDSLNGSVAYSVTMVETTGLALPKRGMGSSYPESGTLMSKLESTLGLDISVTVTFNGTSVVTKTTRVNGETETCTVDLKSPAARPVCFAP